MTIISVLTIIWIQDSQTLGKNEKSDIIQNGHVIVTRNVWQNNQPNSDENIKSVTLRRGYKNNKKYGVLYRLHGRGNYETDETQDDDLSGSYLNKKTNTSPKERVNKSPTKSLKLDDDKVQLLKFGSNPHAVYLYLPFEMTKNSITIF